MEDFFFLIKRCKGRILGVLLGIVIGWMIIRYGWLAAVFWLFCIGIGYIAGTSIDTRKKWREVIEKIFSERFNR